MEDIVRVQIYSTGTAVLKSKLLISCIKQEQKNVSCATGGKWAGNSELGNHHTYSPFLFPIHKREGIGVVEIACVSIMDDQQKKREDKYWEIIISRLRGTQ